MRKKTLENNIWIVSIVARGPVVVYVQRLVSIQWWGMKQRNKSSCPGDQWMQPLPVMCQTSWTIWASEIVKGVGSYCNSICIHRLFNCLVCCYMECLLWCFAKDRLSVVLYRVPVGVDSQGCLAIKYCCGRQMARQIQDKRCETSQVLYLQPSGTPQWLYIIVLITVGIHNIGAGMRVICLI